MTGPEPPARLGQLPSSAQDSPGGHAGHGGHSWMMIACCIPMLAIAVALVATGVASPGFLLVAVLCTAMMALMMRGMHAEGPDDRPAHTHDNSR